MEYTKRTSLQTLARTGGVRAHTVNTSRASVSGSNRKATTPSVECPNCGTMARISPNGHLRVHKLDKYAPCIPSYEEAAERQLRYMNSQLVPPGPYKELYDNWSV
jgi:hypothetical protein